MFVATPVLARLLLFVVVIVALLFAATKLSGRTLATSLGIGGFLIFCCLMVSYLPFQKPPEVGWSAYPPLSNHDSFLDTTRVVEKSTEEMWEHLNRSRIDLDSASVSVVAESKRRPAELSDAPKASVAPKEPLPEKTVERPDWVDTPPKRVGNVYRVVVSSYPYSTVEECHQSIESKLREVAERRARQLLGDQHTNVIFNDFDLRIGFVLNEICTDEWVEQVESSIEGMKRVHVLMRFDANIDDQLKQVYLDHTRRVRIGQVGGISATIIAGVLLLYGLLKADTWTRGYYTKRLFFGVPAVIIAVVALLV